MVEAAASREHAYAGQCWHSYFLFMTFQGGWDANAIIAGFGSGTQTMGPPRF